MQTHTLFWLVFLFQFIILTSYFAITHSTLGDSIFRSQHKRRIFLLLIVCTQLLTSALLQKEVGDVMLFAGAGWHLRHQIDFYFIDAHHSQYPFFPFLIFFHSLANLIQEQLPFLTFSFFLKLLLMICVLGVARFIRLHSQQGDQERIKKTYAFITHPLVTLSIFFHGQIDIILLVFFVWGAYYLVSRQTMKDSITGSFLYAASIAAKTWSVIFIPLLLKKQKTWFKRLLLIGIVSISLLANVFVYTRLVDGSSVRSVLPAVLKPGGPVGEWGLSLLLSSYKDILSQYNIFIFAGFLLLGLLLSMKRFSSFWDQCLFLVLFVYLIIPNWGIQYLVWSLPFWYLVNIKNRWLFHTYTIIGSLYSFLNYFNITAHLNNESQSVDKSVIKLIGICLWSFIAYVCWKLYTAKNESSKLREKRK